MKHSQIPFLCIKPCSFITPWWQQWWNSLPKLLSSSPEHDQLFYLVYEHLQVAEGSLDPHLWAYRSHITLEHLRRTLQQQNMRKKCPILYAFLQEVCLCVCVCVCVWGKRGSKINIRVCPQVCQTKNIHFFECHPHCVTWSVLHLCIDLQQWGYMYVG